MKILVDPRLFEHPKLYRFASLIGRNPTEAAGYIVRLWAWAVEYRASGSLASLEDREVCSAAGWLGKPSKFISALNTSGWVKDAQIHDWQEHQGKYIARILAERERKRRGSSAEAPRAKASPVPVAVPRTVPVAVPVPYGAPSPDGGVDKVFEPKNGKAARRGTPEGLSATKRLVELWNEGRPENQRIKVTDARRDTVEARLKEFPLATLEAVVLAGKSSPHHNGANERGWRAPGPEWFLGKTERVEQWRAGNGSKVSAPAKPSFRCPMCRDTGKLEEAGAVSVCSCVRRRQA